MLCSRLADTVSVLLLFHSFQVRPVILSEALRVVTDSLVPDRSYARSNYDTFDSVSL